MDKFLRQSTFSVESSAVILHGVLAHAAAIAIRVALPVIPRSRGPLSQMACWKGYGLAAP